MAVGLRPQGVARQQLLSTRAASNELYAGMAAAFREYLRLADPADPGYGAVQQVVRLHDERIKARGA